MRVVVVTAQRVGRGGLHRELKEERIGVAKGLELPLRAQRIVWMRSCEPIVELIAHPAGVPEIISSARFGEPPGAGVLPQLHDAARPVGDEDRGAVAGID
jgi:hypothetical protein